MRSNRTEEEKKKVKDYDRIRKKRKHSILNDNEKSEYILNQRKNINQREKWLQETGDTNKRFRSFKKETKDGPIYICVSCHRCMFRKGVYEMNGKKILALFNSCDPEIILQATNHKINKVMRDDAVKEDQGKLHKTMEQQNKQKYYMCCNCFSTLTRKKKCPRIFGT